MPIQPTNMTAQFLHRARGNPPSVTPDAAISNFFPGLEFDLRAVWKHIFEEIELHESGRVTDGHTVLAVAPNSAAAQAGVQPGDRLIAVDGNPVEGRLITGTGQPVNVQVAFEFFNALAPIVRKAGQSVPCAFRSASGNLSTNLRVRALFEDATLHRDLLEPGAMTQGLCSPWQADYRECGCFYWAASRPDIVNVEIDGTGAVTGSHDWMQRDRNPGDPYRPDVNGGPDHFEYRDLYTSWERILKFVIAGKDSE